MSDIHGHAELLINELKNKGFCSGDAGHMLVCCGDCFDRGDENRRVYDYLNSVPNKVIVCGNHEELLLKALDRGKLKISDIANGTDKTLEDFFGEDSIDGNGNIYVSDSSRAPIDDFLSRTADYYETENYIFVHGWIPVGSIKREDWRRTNATEWRVSRWLGWRDNIGSFRPMDKTIVCGHYPARDACVYDRSRSAEDYSPYYGKGFIAIDGNTVRSRVVNVLVIDDEPLPHKTHQMKLRREFFDLVACGSKTVEMRLFDEKRREIISGDRIIFVADDGSGDTVGAEVLGVYRYRSFEGLTEDFDSGSLGFEGCSAGEISEFMSSVYDREKIEMYGAVAIRVCVGNE